MLSTCCLQKECSTWKSSRESFFVEDMATFQAPLLERQQAPFPAYRPLSEEGLQEKGVLRVTFWPP